MQIKMNMEIPSKRKKNKKMDEEETEAVATKAVRLKRKKKMDRFLSHLFFRRSAIKKKMNKKETEAHKAVPSKRRKKKKMNREETEAVVVRTSNQVRNYLNHDMVIFILSKLPLKSFKRFECVCKSWATLFQNPYFKTMYTKNFISNDNNHYDDTYLLQKLMNNKREESAHFYLLPGQRFEARVKIDWPSPLQKDSVGICILGCASVNGILCLNQFPRRRYLLWNPATSEFKVIPYSFFEDLPCGYQLHGFGYDHVTHDYKVIQSLDSYNNDDETYETFWMLYSLRSNSWRKLDVNLPNHYGLHPNESGGVYMNGVCHWWGITHDSPNLEDDREYLSSFNFSNELMFTTPSPSYLDVRLRGSAFAFALRLVVLNESIALITTDIEMATFEISILGELGLRESWTKLLTITSLPSIPYAIGVGNLSSTVLVRTTDRKYAWMDLNTKMMEKLDIKPESGDYHVSLGKYKKSFLSIGE